LTIRAAISAGSQGPFRVLSAKGGSMHDMNRRQPSLDRLRRIVAAPLPTMGPAAIARLADALDILGRLMHEAAAERRAAPLGSVRRRRADERVDRLNGLYLRLQRRMEIPAEIWLLDSPARPSRRAH